MISTDGDEYNDDDDDDTKNIWSITNFTHDRSLLRCSLDSTALVQSSSILTTEFLTSSCTVYSSAIELLLDDAVEKSSLEGGAATTGRALPFLCLRRPDLRRVPISRSVREEIEGKGK